MTQPVRLTRRQALASTAALALPYIVPASVLAGRRQPAPSDRINIGVIGTGGRGRALIRDAHRYPDAIVTAVADVDANHLAEGQKQAEESSKMKGCAAYRDFRELLKHADLDAVIVATPDHWHALATIAAANAGKDIYCEKPLANSIGEGRAMVEAVKRNKRILQTGSHERSTAGCRKAASLVRSGAIGPVKRVLVSLPTDQKHHMEAKNFHEIPAAVPVPEVLDYDFWLGHTPQAPYHPMRVHFWWRFILNYGGGEMTDRGAHVLDIAQMALKKDNEGPVKVEATGSRNSDSLYNAFWDYEFTNTYADGTQFIGSSKPGPRGLKFEGENGWIFVHIHGGRLEASSPDLLNMQPESLSAALPDSPGHMRNWLDCVKSRQEPFAPVEAGHRTASLCHLNNIAMTVGRPLEFDPEKEQIRGDEEANALVTPAMRAPWTLG